MTLSDSLPCVGQEVTLRRLKVDDLEAFQAYRHDPNVARLQGWVPVPDSDARSFLKSMNVAPALVPGEWIQLGIADRISGLLIGDIGLLLREDQRHGEIGISLRTESQGRGYATEATMMALDLLFRQTSIETILATTDLRNTAAKRLLERVGMEQISSERTIFRGLPCTEITLSISRPTKNG